TVGRGKVPNPGEDAPALSHARHEAVSDGKAAGDPVGSRVDAGDAGPRLAEGEDGGAEVISGVGVNGIGLRHRGQRDQSEREEDTCGYRRSLRTTAIVSPAIRFTREDD